VRQADRPYLKLRINDVNGIKKEILEFGCKRLVTETLD
jgi:hypothetical protein